MGLARLVLGWARQTAGLRGALLEESLAEAKLGRSTRAAGRGLRWSWARPHGDVASEVDDVILLPTRTSGGGLRTLTVGRSGKDGNE